MLVREFKSKYFNELIVNIIVTNLVTQLAAIHAKRVTIQEKDMKLV